MYNLADVTHCKRRETRKSRSRTGGEFKCIYFYLISIASRFHIFLGNVGSNIKIFLKFYRIFLSHHGRDSVSPFTPAGSGTVLVLAPAWFWSLRTSVLSREPARVHTSSGGTNVGGVNSGGTNACGRYSASHSLAHSKNCSVEISELNMSELIFTLKVLL